MTTAMPGIPRPPTDADLSRWRFLGAKAATEKLPEGLDAAWSGMTGRLLRLKPRRGPLMRQAAAVLKLESEFSDLSTARLREQLSDLQAIWRRGRETRADRIRAAAAIREAVFRTTSLRLYRVQVAAGLGMDAGYVIEMATGEGKTLAAVIPAVLAGWRGRGCHVLTANDYLAARDAETNRPTYALCGLSVAAVTSETEPDQRRAGYAADITYSTNKEATADYLRDRIARRGQKSVVEDLHRALAGLGRSAHAGAGGPVMRGLAYAIVDEADALLIDEAVTPLIISAESRDADRIEAYREAAEAARSFEKDKHYRRNPRHREVRLTRRGHELARELTEQLGPMWRGARRREELIVQAVTAIEFYKRGEQYVIDPEEEKIVIVDEFTGRLMPDRSWRAGLHQAVEAKEGVEIQPMKDTLARLSFQRFFRSYPHLAGMTGTAMEARGEFWKVYQRHVVPVPTHRPCRRKHRRDRIFARLDASIKKLVAEVVDLHAEGRPVLIGTRSVEASERIATALAEHDIQADVLNAVRHREEAHIVAQAGQPGAVTVATNMAGRGTDIKLGRDVAAMGGLVVLAAERNTAGRIDRQLFGRAGRQGDPGLAAAYVSMEDELIRRHAPWWLRRLTLAALRARLPIAATLLGRFCVRRAHKRAEAQARRQRVSVLRHDEWLDEQLGFSGREE